MLAERAQCTARSRGCQRRLTGAAGSRNQPGSSEIRGRNELIRRDGEVRREKREKKEERKGKERERERGKKLKKCFGFFGFSSGLKTRFYTRNRKRNFNYFLRKF